MKHTPKIIASDEVQAFNAQAANSTDPNYGVLLDRLFFLAKNSRTQSKFVMLAQAVLKNAELPQSLKSSKDLEGMIDLHGHVTETVKNIIESHVPSAEQLHRDAGGFRVSLAGIEELVDSKLTRMYGLAARDYTKIPPQEQLKAFVKNVEALVTKDTALEATNEANLESTEAAYG